MKLHLAKSLRAALLACVCGGFAVTGQAMAENYPSTGNATADVTINNNNVSDFAGYDNIYMGDKTLTVDSGLSSDFSSDAVIHLDGGTLYVNKTWGERDPNAVGASATRGTVTLSGNGGTISSNDGGGHTFYAKKIDGTGDLTISGNGNLYVLGSIENSGNLTLGTKAQLGGSYGSGGGNPTTVTDNVDDVTVTGKDVVLYSTSVENSGSFTIETGSSLKLAGGSTIELNGVLTNNGTLTLDSAGLDATKIADSLISTETTEIGYTNGSNGFYLTSTTYTGLIGENGSLIKGTGSVSVSNSILKVGYGTGTLAADGTAIVEGHNGTYYVNEGTVNGSTDLGIAAAVEVSSGATLHFSGNKDDNKLDITLDGGTMTMDGSINGNVGAYQVFTGTITLKNGASIEDVNYEAPHGLISNGGKIVAEGTGNEISSVVSLRQKLTMEVNGETGVLTLSDDIITNSSGTNTRTLTKTGEGTLVFASSATVSSNVALNLSEGTLDLSNVTTLNAKELNLAAGTTLILGEGPLQFTGTLKVQDGAIIDISSWGTTVEDFYDEELFTGGTTLEFLASEDGTPGTGFVQIYFGGGDTVLWPNWLIKHDDAPGSVYAIPEPATATLSLLALAGLAARRRRK